ncbi:MAG TPA: efflux RND transporter periplasmic adaptor subunit [Polyangiaceae bacterium]|nr:efflux RND transporter periplasmic adaptor subunit [Polyangiaceae bacterium]
MRTLARYVFALLGLAAILGGLGAVKYKQISTLIAMGRAMKAAGPPPQAVATTLVRTDTWQSTLDAVGSVAAAKGVTVSNDAPGIVSAIHFESGAAVRQGQVLLELDSNVERAQLASVLARQELAQVNARRTRALVAAAAIAPSQQDNDDAIVRTSGSDLDQLRAQIDRKIVRAPFSGKLGIRLVNLGQYLNPGTPIAELAATETIFVDFTLPQEKLRRLTLGMPVRVVIEGEGTAPVDGTLAAIDPAIDATTRSIKLRASLPNREEKLLPGMFARVSVVLPDRRQVTILPVSGLVHASYGDSVFVVEDRKDDAGNPVLGPDGRPAKAARQQFVKVSETRGDFAAVVSGVTSGQEVVTAGAFKLQNGAPVAVNAAAEQPKADLSPHPENH